MKTKLLTICLLLFTIGKIDFLGSISNSEDGSATSEKITQDIILN